MMFSSTYTKVEREYRYSTKNISQCTIIFSCFKENVKVQGILTFKCKSWKKVSESKKTSQEKNDANWKEVLNGKSFLNCKETNS